jgi:hypothetical protein
MLQISPTCFSLQAMLKDICTHIFYRRYPKFSECLFIAELPGLIKIYKICILV